MKQLHVQDITSTISMLKFSTVFRDKLKYVWTYADQNTFPSAVYLPVGSTFDVINDVSHNIHQNDGTIVAE
jgi:hypothetical protein